MPGAKPKLGFVGLGNMGAPMAAHLATAGFALAVFDISPGVAAGFAAKTGAKAAGSLKEVGALSDIAITCLPNGDIVRDVVLGGRDNLADAMAAGTIVVDMSSSDPIHTAALGKALDPFGIAMADAPVSGGVKGAKAASLTIMAGGSADIVEKLRPILETMGKRVFHTGGLGTGQAMKALNNLCSAAGFLIVVEALKAGEKFGLDKNVMTDILNVSTGRNNSSENKIKQYVLSGKYQDAGFAMDLMVKDISAALDLANTLETPMPLGAATVSAWRQALDDLGDSPDHTEIARWLELVEARAVKS